MLSYLLRMIMSHSAVQALASTGGAKREVPETEALELVGTTLEGAYRITRLIAKGGMSAVYEAIQVRLNQRVAVKVMARELASNQEALARFHREAEITSQLRHPHLVTVMDFGTAPAGEPYLVMEHLDGIDLDHRIRRDGKLPLPTAVHITKQVASALAAAHDQGIVHRDLKPANVFLVELPGEPDFAKILDFGISKVRAAGTQLTKASSILGTPNYMSPEQATGMLDEIDHRTDQWALACIVWEMLSGRAPFASDEISAVFYQVIHLDPQPLRKRAPGVPAAVEAVLHRALSKNMAARFPSTRDFADALASAAFEQAADSAAGEGRRCDEWVERRRSRQERRRSDAPPFHKLKRVGLLLAVAAALVLGGLLSSRWGRGRKVDVPAPTPSAVATPAAASLAKESLAPRPFASQSKPKRPGLDEAGARPVIRANRHKAAEGEPDTSDPFESPRRPVGESAGRAGSRVDDAVDPFATMPAGKPKLSKTGKAERDFVDPFGP
jgi:eukaryotic-like serine/threonine-protein kinase